MHLDLLHQLLYICHAEHREELKRQIRLREVKQNLVATRGMMWIVGAWWTQIAMHMALEPTSISVGSMHACCPVAKLV